METRETERVDGEEKERKKKRIDFYILLFYYYAARRSSKKQIVVTWMETLFIYLDGSKTLLHQYKKTETKETNNLMNMWAQINSPKNRQTRSFVMYGFDE
jgi:hypothetical protein